MTSKVLCMQTLASEAKQMFDHFSIHVIFIHQVKVLHFTEKMVLYMTVRDFVNLPVKIIEFQVL